MMLGIVGKVAGAWSYQEVSGQRRSRFAPSALRTGELVGSRCCPLVGGGVKSQLLVFAPGRSSPGCAYRPPP